MRCPMDGRQIPARSIKSNSFRAAPRRSGARRCGRENKGGPEVERTCSTLCAKTVGTGDSRVTLGKSAIKLVHKRGWETAQMVCGTVFAVAILDAKHEFESTNLLRRTSTNKP